MLQSPLRLLLVMMLIAPAACALGAEQSASAIERGEAIYRESCAKCHGPRGEGVNEYYAKSLAGTLSLAELAEVISETMPEGDPDTCVGEEAAAVAGYIHEAFYSEAARIRDRPPRVALARLTGNQLRQSLADLFGYFHPSPGTAQKRGVEAIYFDGVKWQKDKRRIERIDPVIDFDFGKKSPGEGIDATNFYIHWTGSLKVDRTGRYEIVLRSSCSCMLYFGATDRVLINNHVQSSGKEEFRRAVYLTGGRTYPLKLEFFQRKRKTEQPPAKISLRWVPPQGVEEVIPNRHLIPETFPATFSLQAKLPPDDRSYGYERGIAIDRGWDDSTTQAAIEFAQFAIDELYPRYRKNSKKDDDDKDRAKLKEFLQELIETAFRGPLDEATRTDYIDRHVDAVDDDAEVIKRVILATLKSPRFLYPTLDANRSKSQRVANRLALVLYDSLPADAWLIGAAQKDQLQTDVQIGHAAERMMGDYRAQAKTKAFLYEWFGLAHIDEIVKDTDAFPDFDPALVHDLRRSLDNFFDQVISSEASDFRQLLQADWAYTSPRIEQFYGESWKPKSEPEGAVEIASTGGLQRSVSDPVVHVGAITHPLLMSKLAYHQTTSPIHRGVFLNRYLLGRVIRPPQDAFTPLDPDLHPGLTTRQRVDLQTGEVNCQVCHSRINALGFTLENFDATGRWRTVENMQPIDTAGGYVTSEGTNVTIEGARSLGDFLARSEDCHHAFVETAFEHFVKQPIAAYGADRSAQLTESFRASGFNIRKLILSIAVIAAESLSEQKPGT